MINHVNMIIFFPNKESHVRKWRVCFQNVEILLRMCLCLMVTHYTGERSFSKLRRIKNAQRTTIGQGRLDVLTLMSIESELLRTIDVNSIIDDFARVKARQHNMWRKQLYTVTLIVSEKQLHWLV